MSKSLDIKTEKEIIYRRSYNIVQRLARTDDKAIASRLIEQSKELVAEMDALDKQQRDMSQKAREARQ
jgi:hypothetical protein